MRLYLPFVFFFNVTATTEIYTLSLHHALPISEHDWARTEGDEATLGITWHAQDSLGELVHYEPPDEGVTITKDGTYGEVESVKDRKSTRLNSSHANISYAVFCLKKKTAISSTS